jgi:hypothetical protein
MVRTKVNKIKIRRKRSALKKFFLLPKISNRVGLYLYPIILKIGILRLVSKETIQ